MTPCIRKWWCRSVGVEAYPSCSTRCASSFLFFSIFFLFFFYLFFYLFCIYVSVFFTFFLSFIVLICFYSSLLTFVHNFFKLFTFFFSFFLIPQYRLWALSTNATITHRSNDPSSFFLVFHIPPFPLRPPPLPSHFVCPSLSLTVPPYVCLSLPIFVCTPPRCLPHQVAVGMYRLGPSTTATILGEFPDISVYGKMLSGGYMPLAATLATAEVFNAFLGKKKWHALLHGHSFTVSNMIFFMRLIIL